MYSKVIVPLDGSDLSEQSLPYAELIAKSLNVPIELVQAYDILPPSLLGGSNRQRVVSALEEGSRARALVSMENQRRRLEGDGLSVNLVAQRGPAADVIVAVAGADPTALVVMSTHGRGGISRWVMGSVTDKVLHTIPNPMLIVRANVLGPAAPESSLRSVVVPLDGSPLSELAIPHAISVAGALSAGITVLRITPSEDQYRTQLNLALPEMGTGTMPDFDMASPDELTADDAAEASDYLDDVRNRMSIDHAHGVATEHQVNDNIAQTIIERASAQPSLVAMTTHGRSGVGRMVLGSVTDRVIRHSNLPVLVIR
jgi:nucleotide-binding universal stress UspA family protein